ncbi:MAG: glycosyltransferase [bacterium]|nr:glycosyltransferase [bacterium]
MSRIRVCMVVNNFDVGGLEKLVIDLLRKIDRDVFDLFVVCIEGEGKLFSQVDLPDGHSQTYNKAPNLNLGVLKVDTTVIASIRRFLRDNLIDIVHAHNVAPLVYAGFAAHSLPRRPRVVYSEHNQIYSSSRFDKFKFWFYANLADEIVAVSHDLARTLKALRLRPPIRVIHNGIDGSRFTRVDGSGVRKEFDIADDEFLCGTAVVLSEQKGVLYLLEAAAIVIAEEPSVRFLLAGDGPLREELEQRAREMNLGNRVIFPGYRNDVPVLISAYDTYVLPSLWEGLPLALLEALAIGTPIICTMVGGNPEVVEDGVNGFLVTPRDPAQIADRILHMKRSGDFIDRVRKSNQKRFVDEFSLDRMTENYEAFFREVASA